MLLREALRSTNSFVPHKRLFVPKTFPNDIDEPWISQDRHLAGRPQPRPRPRRPRTIGTDVGESLPVAIARSLEGVPKPAHHLSRIAETCLVENQPDSLHESALADLVGECNEQPSFVEKVERFLMSALV